MRGSHCRSELLVRGRRRALTSTETLALRAHLVDCPSCRLVQQIADDFREEPAAVTDDSALMARMSETARLWAGQRERRRVAPRVRVWRPVWIAAMAASLVLIAGSVSALLLWRRPQSAPSSPKSSTRALVHPARLVAREAPAVTPTPPSTAPEPLLPSQPVSVRRASRALSPALLLQRATEARRRGDVAEAITRYHRLQQVFPTSSEAVLSAAPLGGLLLERGATVPALGQFDRYLRAAPAGVLVPEALYGRGRALRALGQAAEERQTWQRLIAAFPDSPYAPLARRRLTDLQ